MGAAALNLMIKQNLITEDSILDGSLFHNCDRELVFNKNNSKMQKIKDSSGSTFSQLRICNTFSAISCLEVPLLVGFILNNL